jgi:hypothetical protein
MSGHGLQAFTDSVADEAATLFITYRGHRLWLDWHTAHEFAFFCSLIHHRKQEVKGAFVAGRWYWFVRVAPSQSGDGAGAPILVHPSRAGAATSSPVPSSPHLRSVS